MRGTRRNSCRRVPTRRIIPAYAGNTQQTCSFLRLKRDHPRICGEHRNLFDELTDGQGSSPHMRGTQNASHLRPAVSGIIPAYAGNTLRLRRMFSSTRDHPRICGEHHGQTNKVMTIVGSSPHMRGTLIGGDGLKTGRGIIPAYAGNTLVFQWMMYASRDHPRICGEHMLLSCVFARSLGSSPHMRGTPPESYLVQNCRGIIPAYAGNTCSLRRLYLTQRDHPRICGEHLGCVRVCEGVMGSSPHMRGTPGLRHIAI